MHRYLSIHRDRLDPSAVESPHEYYTRMCMGAEMMMRFRKMEAESHQKPES